MVVYTGSDTKIVLNQGKYQFKQSQLDKSINYMTLWNMVLIFILAGIMTSKAVNFIKTYRKPGVEGAYYIFEDSPSDMGVKAFGSYYLLLN